MGADVYFFRATKIDDEVVQKIKGQDVEEMSEKYNFHYKDEKDMTKRMDDYAELLPYMKTVLMRRKKCNQKQCFTDMGLPEDAKYYSISYRQTHLILQHEGKSITVPYAKLREYDYIEEELYYIWKQESVDAEPSGYTGNFIWGIANEFLRKRFNDNQNHTYCPHKLTKAESDYLMLEIVKAAKNEDIYFESSELASILMVLIENTDEELFIIGQN